MKKIFAVSWVLLILAVIFTLTFGGCASQPATTTAPPPPKTSAPATSAPPSPPQTQTSAPPTSAPAPPPKTSAPPTSAPPPPPQAKTLQIAYLAQLEGWASQGDVKSLQGGQIAADLYNKKGGLTLNGVNYKIELISEDGKSTADGCAAAARRLVFDKKIKFIAGSFVFLAGAAAPITEPAKVLRCLSWNVGTPEEIGPKLPYTFVGNASSLEGAIASAQYLKQFHPDIKTVAVVMPDDGVLPVLAPRVQKVLTDTGLTMVGGDIILFPNDMIDFSPIVAKVVSRKPDGLFQVNGYAPVVGSILKGIRESNWKGIYGVTLNASSKEVIAVSGKAAGTNFYTLSPVPGDPQMPALLNEINDITMQKYGDISGLYLAGFNAVWTMLKAIEAAKSLDTTVVRDVWEKLDTIDTCYGTGWMGGLQTYGIRRAVTHKIPIEYVDQTQKSTGTWIEVRTP